MHSSKQQVPHTFQQSMSSKSTPVLSCAISDFETFMTDWEILRDEHEGLKYWMEIGLDWAKKYYIRMDKTDAYVVTMCKFYTLYVTTLAANLNLQSSIQLYDSHGLMPNGKLHISSNQRNSFLNL